MPTNESQPLQIDLIGLIDICSIGNFFNLLSSFGLKLYK